MEGIWKVWNTQIHFIKESRKKHCLPVGKQAVLSKDDDCKLRKEIIALCKWGFPLGGYDIRLIVKSNV